MTVLRILRLHSGSMGIGTMTETNVYMGTEVGCGGREPHICLVFWGLCRVLKNRSGVLVQESMNLPPILYAKLCISAHIYAFPWGEGL